jgi:hypothetical protein
MEMFRTLCLECVISSLRDGFVLNVMLPRLSASGQPRMDLLPG